MTDLSGLGNSLHRSTIRRIGLIVFRAQKEDIIFHLVPSMINSVSPLSNRPTETTLLRLKF